MGSVQKAIEMGLYMLMLWGGPSFVMVFDHDLYQLAEFYQFHR